MSFWVFLWMLFLCCLCFCCWTSDFSLWLLRVFLIRRCRRAIHSLHFLWFLLWIVFSESPVFYVFHPWRPFSFCFAHQNLDGPDFDVWRSLASVMGRVFDISPLMSLLAWIVCLFSGVKVCVALTTSALWPGLMGPSETGPFSFSSETWDASLDSQSRVFSCQTHPWPFLLCLGSLSSAHLF